MEFVESFPELKPFLVGADYVDIKAIEDVYWVSETPEDKHLAAHFGVAAEKLDQRRSRYHVFTVVRYLHWTGPVYFNLIRPFHHLVVSRMMKHGVGA
jgi:hypothetical protein